MEGIERIHKLLDQLAEAVAEAFPNADNMYASLATDGYRSFRVEKWKREEDTPVEAWKRRELFEQHRIGFGDWSSDRSKEQNEYYRRNRTLLEDGGREV